jgi:hypothetical protein
VEEKVKENKKNNEEKQKTKRRKRLTGFRRTVGVNWKNSTVYITAGTLFCSFPRCLLFLITTVIICDASPDILPAYAWRNLKQNRSEVNWPEQL